MPIPKNIKREHVLSALSEIDNHGVPDERNSTKFNLFYNGQHYPPKYVLTIANKYANGHELLPSEFSGGKESNSFLSGLGFEIISNSDQLVMVSKDIESELAEEDDYYQDGAVRYYYGKRYERNPINRQKAIEIHGLSCMACGFNFEEVYGEHGKDFIEVHHVKPLSTVKEEMEINPAEDLVTLCSNCHRMVHRRRDHVLKLEELKELIGQKGDL